QRMVSDDTERVGPEGTLRVVWAARAARRWHAAMGSTTVPLGGSQTRGYCFEGPSACARISISSWTSMAPCARLGAPPSKNAAATGATSRRSPPRARRGANRGRQISRSDTAGTGQGAGAGLLAAEGLQEVGVGGADLEALEQRLGGVPRVHVGQQAAEAPHPLQVLGREQQLLAAGAGAHHVERREDAAVGQLAREVELHVPGPLEL